MTFPLSAKLDVNGPHRHPLYRFLTAAESGITGDISWNFEKFLIGRDGRIAYKLVGPITPDNFATVLKPQIEKALAGS